MAGGASGRGRQAVTRAGRLSVAVLCLALLLSACGGKDADKTPPGTNTLPTSSATPDAPAPVTVTGLPAGVDVQVDGGDPGTSPGGGLDFVSPVYTLGPAGPLGATATVTIQLDHAVPSGTTVVVGTRPSNTDSWSWLPATLTSDLRHARFTTTHFSQFGVLTLDVAGALATYKQKVHGFLTSTLQPGVDKPLCEDPKTARTDGYRVASWPRKTLAWCFGMKKDRRVLTVVNRRAFPVQVSHGDAAVRSVVSKTNGVWTTWLGILAPGSKDTFLAPGGKVSYDAELDPGENLVVGAEYDAVAQSTRALYAAVRALVTQLVQYGVSTPSSVQAFQVLVARPQCADALGQSSEVLRLGCLSPVRLSRVLGANTRLLVPVLRDPSMKKFWQRQFVFLARQDQAVDTQHVGVSRAPADFGDLVGTFTGHTRVLTVSKTGMVTERLDDGTDRVILMTYQLSDPQVTGRKPGQKTGGTTTAKAVLTKVKVYDRKAIGGRPPKVGDVGTITYRNGIVTPPYLQTNYCDKAAARKGQCGA